MQTSDKPTCRPRLGIRGLGDGGESTTERWRCFDGSFAMTIPASARLQRNESLAFAELDDQIVMLEPSSGCYFELDPVGSRIWALLEDKRNLAELRDSLTAEFEIDDETCLREVAAFVDSLASHGLIHMDST